MSFAMPHPVSTLPRFLSVLLLIGTIFRPVEAPETERVVIDHELPSRLSRNGGRLGFSLPCRHRLWSRVA